MSLSEKNSKPVKLVLNLLFSSGIPEHQDHPRSADEQVQRLRLRHHDQLRRVLGRHPVPQRLHPRQPSPTSQLQDQQTQDVKKKVKRVILMMQLSKSTTE